MSSLFDWYVYVDDHGQNKRIMLNKRIAAWDPGTTGTTFCGAVVTTDYTLEPVDGKMIKPRYAYWKDVTTGHIRKLIACTTTCRAYNPIASPVASMPKGAWGVATEANNMDFWESEGERWFRGGHDAAS